MSEEDDLGARAGREGLCFSGLWDVRLKLDLVHVYFYVKILRKGSHEETICESVWISVGPRVTVH